MDKSQTIIFTDGSSRGNPGPGGWGSVLVTADVGGTGAMGATVMELGGGERNTTNNRMEIMAAIRALEETVGDDIVLYTDSSYLINGITKWVRGWKRNGWQTLKKEDVSNRDLWERLDAAVVGKKIDWRRIGGHVGVAGNERCDTIATSYADGEEPTLYRGPLSGYEIRNILDVSHDVGLASAKDSGASRSKAKAYSYISMVGGKIETHKTWADCEGRVKGVRGARFKKSLDAAEEAKIIVEFKNI